MLEQILKRDRLVVLSGVVGLAGLAWLELWRRHGAMAMDAAMPRPAPWALPDLGAAAIMWSVMMIAMMVPSFAGVLNVSEHVEQLLPLLGTPGRGRGRGAGCVRRR